MNPKTAKLLGTTELRKRNERGRRTAIGCHRV